MTGRVVCPDCAAYVAAFRTVLLPVVGRQVQQSGEPPADVVRRITDGAHRRNHQAVT